MDRAPLQESGPPPLLVTPLVEALLPAWRALFDAAGSACYCRYWDFAGDKNAWLDRCFNSPAASYDEQAALVRAGDPRARGLVALDGEACVGWMKLAPRALLPKLRNLPVYRACELGPDEGVYSVGCMLVHPARRRAGIARALLAAAEPHARNWGATAIEMYPRRAGHELHDEEAWLGPLRLALSLGYREIAGEGPYPVLRKELSELDAAPA
jgi:GNAT superfamily N-acetyltransferase